MKTEPILPAGPAGPATIAPRASAASAATPAAGRPDGIDARPAPTDALRGLAARLQRADVPIAAGSDAAQGAPSTIPSGSPVDGTTNSAVGMFDAVAGTTGPRTSAPREAFAVRFDQPHVEVPPQAVTAAGAVARVLEGVERAAVPVTMAIDAGRLAGAFASDGGHVGTQTLDTAASVTGGWIGGLAGAETGGESGAAVGAAVGALFAGVGALPGAAIGGALGSLSGGIVGAFGGSWLAARTLDATGDIKGQ